MSKFTFINKAKEAEKERRMDSRKGYFCKKKNKKNRTKQKGEDRLSLTLLELRWKQVKEKRARIDTNAQIERNERKRV